MAVPRFVMGAACDQQRSAAYEDACGSRFSFNAKKRRPVTASPAAAARGPAPAALDFASNQGNEAHIINTLRKAQAQMAHTIKSGKNEITISSARLVRQADRMAQWSPERRSHAAEAAKKRLHGKHPQKRDAATALAVTAGGKG
jgi:hypothetical protein